METQQKLQELIQKTAELHHKVFWFTDGADSEWPLWYAEQLVKRSGLSDVLGKDVSVSEVVHLLVKTDKLYNAEQPDEEWGAFAAKVISGEV